MNEELLFKTITKNNNFNTKNAYINCTRNVYIILICTDFVKFKNLCIDTFKIFDLK